MFDLRYAEIGLSVDAFGRSIDQYDFTLSFLVERASGQFDYIYPKLRRVFNAWMLLPLRTSEDSSSSESDGEAWFATFATHGFFLMLEVVLAMFEFRRNGYLSTVI